MLLERGWVASGPLNVRVLSALKTKRADLLIECEADVVARLVEACRDEDAHIAAQAREVLQQLQSESAIEALCRLCIEVDDPITRQAVILAQYAPRDTHQRAVFYFLTGQWDQYESLDFDHSLLRTVYEAGDESLRKRIAAQARQAGRVEWVAVAAGGQRGLRLGEMKDEEWEAVMDVLGAKQRWAEMWRLAQIGPPRWCARLLRKLKEAGWSPDRVEDQSWSAELMRLLERDLDMERRAPDLLARGRIVPFKYNGGITCFAISHDGLSVAVGSRNGMVQVRDLSGEMPPAMFETGLWECSSLALSPDKRMIATGSERATQLWALSGDTPSKLGEWESGEVFTLSFSPDGKWLAGISLQHLDNEDDWNSQVLRLWKLPQASLWQTMDCQGVILSISPDSHWIAVADGWEDSSIKLLKLMDGTFLKRLGCGAIGISCLTISPDGGTIASGGRDGAVKIWDSVDGSLLKLLEANAVVDREHDYGRGILGDIERILGLENFDNLVRSLAISPDGRLLTGVCWEGSVHWWSLPEGVLQRKLKCQGNHFFCLSGNGQMMIDKSDDGELRLWNLEALRLSYTPIKQDVTSDLNFVQQTLRNRNLSEEELTWLEFIEALLRWKWRFDVEVEDAPRRIEIGEFEIELEG
jgi:WD40 repeat protein